MFVVLWSGKLQLLKTVSNTEIGCFKKKKKHIQHATGIGTFYAINILIVYIALNIYIYISQITLLRFNINKCTKQSIRLE